MSRFLLARRTFLRGAGVSLALPLLEAMRPAARAAAPAKPPLRMAFVFVPNGVAMERWTPTTDGDGFSLSPTLEPLAEVKPDITVFTGLGQDNGRAKGDGAGDHARAAASFLTGAHPYKTSGADIYLGVSVDQAAAAQIGSRTKLPSLELGIEKGSNAGNCDSGYSCAYSCNISWRTPTTPTAKEVNPRLVFQRLFGDGQQQADPNRDLLRRSILDSVAADAERLQGRLGQTDRRKLDEYLTSVRELEQRIGRAAQAARQPKPAVAAPAGIPKDFAEHVRLMFDLLVLAFRTDTTRIATFMLANDGNNRSYPMIGVGEGHHELSHHQGRAETLAKIAKIDRYLVEQLAYFLTQLKSVPEGDEHLLHHAMVLYGSGLSDGNRHDHHNLPIVLAGRGGGTLRSGRHVRVDRETPLNNLFLSLLDRAGAKVDKLGDSTGRLTVVDA
jgi:hypothetical protein